MNVTRPKIKIKTRATPQPPAPITEAKVLTPSNPTTRQPTFLVDARAFKVFRTISFNRAVTSSLGEVPWHDFPYAMTSVGFFI